jgi:hypothetical protein
MLFISSVKSVFFGKTENLTKKPKPNKSVFHFMGNLSVPVSWKTEFYLNKILFKPNN